jgi:hypothetical protein
MDLVNDEYDDENYNSSPKECEMTNRSIVSTYATGL